MKCSFTGVRFTVLSGLSAPIFRRTCQMWLMSVLLSRTFGYCGFMRNTRRCPFDVSGHLFGFVCLFRLYLIQPCPRTNHPLSLPESPIRSGGSPASTRAGDGMSAVGRWVVWSAMWSEGKTTSDGGLMLSVRANANIKAGVFVEWLRCLHERGGPAA